MNEQCKEMIFGRARKEMREHWTWCEYDSETGTSAQIFRIRNMRWKIAVWTPDAYDDPILYAAGFQSGAIAGVTAEGIRMAYAMALAIAGDAS